MVAHKASQVASLLRSPRSLASAILLYGPDAGLVSERASVLARSRASGGTVVRLDDRDLAERPGRLFVELRTTSLFGEAPVVRVAAGPRLDVPGLKALLAEPIEGTLIVEAGNLRPDSALRKLFEKDPNAAALPCYSETRDLVGLIDEEMKRAGLRIEPEAKRHLVSLLGSDHGVARSEIAKLALSAHGRDLVRIEDVTALVGDSSELGLEAFAYRVSGEDAAGALAELDRLAQSGVPPDATLPTLGRHFTQLHRVQAAVEAGASIATEMAKLRPRPHFKRTDAFTTACRHWGAERLAHALTQIREAAAVTRREPALVSARVESLVLAIVRPGAS